MTLYDENGNPIVTVDQTDEGVLISKPEGQEPQNVVTTLEKMKKIFHDAPEERVQEFYNTFNKYARTFRVDDELHENFFLAQIVAETGYALDG